MDQEGLERSCEEFKARYVHLSGGDPDAVVEGFIHFFAGEAFFVRPAVRAALELGAEEFLQRLEANLNMALEGFTRTLRLAVTDLDERDLHALAKAIRRLFFAGLIDVSMTPAEFEGELRALVIGMTAERHQPAAPVPLGP
jgi:hypothetical protein